MAKWVNVDEYNSWRQKNADDPYGLGIFEFAERWASLMEEKLATGAKLKDIAHESEREADTDGITGFMYGAAVSVLSHCWIHGEELRKWHNGEYNQPDAKGVVNPALMSIEF